MNERRRFAPKEKMKIVPPLTVWMDLDFGRYHYSSLVGSEKLREQAYKEFSSLLPYLYPSDSVVSVLDAGCGLGFLMYVVARHFPNAKITGIDVFNHGSLIGGSIEKAKENMHTLGIDSRVSILRHDLTEPLDTGEECDLAVSSLVFHNLGRRRFKGYETVFRSLKSGGFFVIGDVFLNSRADMSFFKNYSTVVTETGGIGSGKWYYKIKVLKKK